MHAGFKKYFIPHAENKYHPHILHPKRAIFYSAFFIGLKALVLVFVMLIPLPAFVTPDVLAVEQDRLVGLINCIRAAHDRPALEVRSVLNRSANLKAGDMAEQQYFSHVGPHGHTLDYFLRQAGYSYATAGENLAMGFFSADEVVRAWEKSPGHYANMIDSEYVELGTSMMSGLYTDIPTAYAVAHFGTPEKALPATDTNTDSSVSETPRPSQGSPAGGVLSKKVTAAKRLPTTSNTPPQPASLFYDTVASSIGWQETERGVLVTPMVTLIGPVKKASVEIQGAVIELSPSVGSRVWRGESLVPYAKDEIFKVVVPGTLVVEGPNGEALQDSVNWNNPPLISPTPLQRYLAAESQVPVAARLFTFSRAVYAVFLVLFSLALVALIAIEVRKQHPHIILQTASMLALLVVLLVL
jgi:uncharacterized protein YkwD